MKHHAVAQHAMPSDGTPQWTASYRLLASQPAQQLSNKLLHVMHKQKNN
jgi:hypothetical protein